MAKLYIVATPIGNLADTTYRAVETLKAVDVIACEDTRRTAKLLAAYAISKPLLSCRAPKELEGARRICALLDEGKQVAYASDAGTPGISDPGSIVVDLARDHGHTVTPIPGPSAFATLCSVSRFPGKTVIFDGFLSPKAGKRRKRLAELAAYGDSFLLYESPFRIVKLLADVADICPERTVLIGREMTKLHEEFLEADAKSLSELLASRQNLRGEFSVLVSARKKH